MVTNAGTLPSASLRAPWLALALICVQLAGVAAGLCYVTHHITFLYRNVFERLLTWDGGWYLNIAQGGYQWNSRLGATQRNNVAFFPLWAFVDRFSIAVFGSSFKTAIVLASWACGLASIFLFEKLARRTVGNAAANTATALYSFWPATSFYLMGYPTGIINICAIAALLSYLSKRVWLAAACIGVGTAAAPTMVFFGAPIGIHYMITQFRSKPLNISVRNTLGWMLLSLSGVLAFVLYQQLAFRDPLAFIEAQTAWGYAPAVIEKLHRLSTISYETFEWRVGLNTLSKGRADLAAGISAQGRKEVQGGIQNLVNFVSFMFCLIGLAASAVLIKRHRLVVVLSGFGVVAGYVWFILLTNANMLNVPRLTFPALAIFLGLGALVAKMPGFVKAALIGLFALVSMLEMAFVAAGYWVT